MLIPIIDISPFLVGGNALAKRAAASRFYDACANVGFFYIIGHGVEEIEFQNIFQKARLFFNSSEEEKDKIGISKNDFARGYQKLGQNVTQYKNDWHEGLDLYSHISNDQRHLFKTKTLTGENIWPDIDGFKEAFEDYFLKMDRIGEACMRCMALSLGLDEGYFYSKMNKSFWCARVIGYPELKVAEFPNAGHGSEVGISCGEHTDYGCFTLLLQDQNRDSLQVLSKSNEWINANPIPEALVCNIGDMIDVWTNGLFKSTLHRVIHKSSSYRVSIPYFFEPNLDTVVEPIPQIVEKTGGVAKYKSVLYHDHLLAKMFRVLTAPKLD